MRTQFVVVLAPLLDADPGVDAIPEPLERQILVAELAVERFVGRILPRLPGINERRIDARLVRATAGSRPPRTRGRCRTAETGARRGRSPAG